MKDLLAKKNGVIEVEDILDVAKVGTRGDAESMAKLAQSLSGQSNQRDVPLADWARAAALFLEGGPSALVGAVTSGSLQPNFALGLLEEIFTTASVDAIMAIAQYARSHADYGSVLRAATALNLLLCFTPSVALDSQTASTVRELLHDALPRTDTLSDRANVYCALRAVGNDETIGMIKANTPLPAPWTGLEKQVISRIRSNLRREHN